MIHIGIPVHNEVETIGPLLWRIRELLSGRACEFLVFVCDDASDDGTSEVLARYAHALPLVLLRNEERSGYAASLERLASAVLDHSARHSRDALVTMQGDFSDPPELLSAMLGRFKGGADLVTVGRGDPEPFRKRLARFGTRLVARRLPEVSSVSDSYATFRVYRLSVLEHAAGRGGKLIRHRGWAANAELLLRVWPAVRRSEEIGDSRRLPRRYRGTRFRVDRELRWLLAAGRDASLRGAPPRVGEAA